MNIVLFLGISLIAIGAFSSGSFSIPFDKTKGWAWENYWLIYCVFAYFVIPLLACFIFCPGFISVIIETPFKIISWVFLLGIIYGVCNLTFGLSLKYLGLSLGFTLSLGIIMLLSTIIPPAIDGRLPIMLNGPGGPMLIKGLFIATIGILISGYAGYRKDKEENVDGKKKNFKKGLAMVLFVGITGASQALGIEQGVSISDAMINIGINPLFQTIPVFLIMFSGSLVITAVWCFVLSYRNNTTRALISSSKGSLISNYGYSALAGVLWFVNFIFFGMGKSRMGEFSFIAWGILMSLTIIAGTLWGFYRGEWDMSSKKTKRFMYLGMIVLLLAAFLIGMSVN